MPCRRSAGRALERHGRDDPLGHEPFDQLAVVPLTDMAPSRVVVAWNEGDANPLIRSFVQIATAAYRD